MTDITIALDPSGEHLILNIPGSHGHSIRVPMDDRGWEAVRTILQARERTRKELSGIGHPSAPTQHLVNEWLKAHSVKKLSGDKKEAKLDEKYLELFGDDELELEIKL